MKQAPLTTPYSRPGAELKERRVLVTGATGYIGGPLCRRLAELGAEVVAVARSAPSAKENGVRWRACDLAKQDQARELYGRVQPEIVFHLAGHAAGARRLDLVVPTFRSNLATSVNLLAVAAEEGCDRVVIPGSLEEPEGECSEAVPSSPYAASKWGASAYSRMFRVLYDTPVVCPRVFMVYGPGRQDPRKLVPYVITSLLRGEAPELGSGARPIDWIYMDDVVDGLLAMATTPELPKSRLDLGSGTAITIRELVARIVGLVGADLQPRFGEQEDRPLVQVRTADVDGTRDRLGWAPRISLDEGLRRTIEYYREQLTAGSLLREAAGT